MKLHATIITLFPEMFQPLDYSITGRAIKRDILNLSFLNPRTFALDKHQTVDDKPYGGGPGMLMKVAPLSSAIKAAKEANPHAKVIFASPKGKLFNQQAAKRLSLESSLIFVAGRYEGIDERIIQQEIDEEWSIGDYILTGGELPIMVMLDSITRLLPQVLGDEQSATQDSFANDLLKYPQYTRPAYIAGQAVPEVLISGNHLKTEQWRLQQALGETWLRRPDLLLKRGLSENELILLREFIESRNAQNE